MFLLNTQAVMEATSYLSNRWRNHAMAQISGVFPVAVMFSFLFAMEPLLMERPSVCSETNKYAEFR